MKTLKGRNHLNVISVRGIIIGNDFKRQRGWLWVGIIWLWIKTNARLLRAW
jgi:hypothetical protein